MRVRPAFTLVEVSLVIGILVLLSALVVPEFVRQIRADALPRSARQLRSLIALVRANAAFDGKRYRVRFPRVDLGERDPFGTDHQPMIEREDDPIREREVFTLVRDPWAIGETFLGKVWCGQVFLARPTIEDIRIRRESRAQGIEQELRALEEDIDPIRPPLYVEPDGTSEWATFVLTVAPRDTPPDALGDEPQLELIVDGGIGLAWMQRPFYDEELDLFESKNWPAVLRQDFLDKRVLTENDVLEIRESQLRGKRVQLEGRKLKEQRP